jgi:nicotinamidase-related amidase
MEKQTIHSLLTPDNCTVVLIDYQPQMFFGIQSLDRQMLINNAVGLAKSAKAFKVPTILTSVASKTFSGVFLPQLQAEFPGRDPIDRTTMNTWEDKRVVDEVGRIGRKKLVLGGLWTEVCIVLPTIQAMQAGYEVYVVADACGGVSAMAHDLAILRMIQAGAVPMTWIQFLLELQRDWARQQTYAATTKIIQEHGGAYGQGILYVQTMIGAHSGG